MYINVPVLPQQKKDTSRHIQHNQQRLVYIIHKSVVASVGSPSTPRDTIIARLQFSNVSIFRPSLSLYSFIFFKTIYASIYVHPNVYIYYYIDSDTLNDIGNHLCCHFSAHGRLYFILAHTHTHVMGVKRNGRYIYMHIEIKTGRFYCQRKRNTCANKYYRNEKRR